MPLDSILRRKERILDALETTTDEKARKLLIERLSPSGVLDAAPPAPAPDPGPTE